MVKPTDVPQVDDASTDDEGESTTPQNDVVDIPVQLWVRDVAFNRPRGQYTITVASARGGEFMVRDLQPASGQDLSSSDTDRCRVVTSKPLSPRIKAAVASTDTLYTLTCPGGPMTLPALQGDWYSETDGGATGGGALAVIAIGGRQAQGTPDDPQHPSYDATAAVPEVSVESSRLEGKRATIVVWATQGSMLRLAPASDTDSGEITFDECTVRPTGAHRPASSSPARLAQYILRCSGVSSLAATSVLADYATGRAGKSPSMSSARSEALANAR